MPALELVPPVARATEPVLDQAQSAAADAVAGDHGSLAVLGVPGAGKTAVAIAGAVRAMESGLRPEKVLVIAPTRIAAAHLRDRLSAAMGRPTGSPVVRTAASAAYAVLAARARVDGLPQPNLVTGAEQDVILRELLAGHSAGEGATVDWAGIVPPDATALAGFREELRNLLMRAAEADLAPADLADLGRRTGRDEWLAAAQVYQEYEDTMALRSMPGDQGGRYDPASVVAVAAYELDQWDEAADGPRPGWDLVIVDDYQDATAATGNLLMVLARLGSRIVVVGNADESVQGYRGAVPGAMGTVSQPMSKGGFGARVVKLTQQYRQHPSLADVGSAIAERIGTRAGAQVRAPRQQTDAVAPVDVLVAPHRYSQSRAIAAHLRKARHGLDGDPVAWGQMVVVARSGAQLRELRSDLLAADIPCETLGDGLALHREPAVAPLLTMVRLALGEQWSQDTTLELLQSRLIGLDSVGVRRLRRALVRRDREAGGLTASADLLVLAMREPSMLEALGEAQGRIASRAPAAVEAGRVAAEATHATPGAVLWAVWETLSVAPAWREAALAGSARDDADLDAVIALLRAAQTFTERMPEAPIRQFLQYLEAQDFAADSLGATASNTDVVTFATPASAAGREWDVVVVAGLDEGVWPNLRLRDSVLGAAHLADLLTTGEEPRPLTAQARVVAARSSREAILNDETRALLVAVTRARKRLVVTCLDADQSRPSRFVNLIEKAAGVTRVDAGAYGGVADLRSAVATLRVEGAEAEEPGRTGYVRMLAHLARIDAAGAHPARWHGVAEPSTSLAYWGEGATVRVSPSRVDAVERCALKWALESAGGQRESSRAQDVGTLVHEIAAALPQGTESQLLAELDVRWAEVGSMATWAQRVEYQKARSMILKLAKYLGASRPAQLAVEDDFAVTLGQARLTGQADRVEVNDGVARIVDFKTGAPMSPKEVPDNGQLAMYQLAANNGGFDGVTRASDASLVYLGQPERVSVNEMVQPPIDDARTRARLDAVVGVMTGQTFYATTNSQCEHCPVRRSCPARPTGRQVSEL